VPPYVWDSNICELKDTFPVLALVIDTVEVKKSCGMFAVLSILLLFLLQKVHVFTKKTRLTSNISPLANRKGVFGL
jgi:hypothetical protein